MKLPDSSDRLLHVPAVTPRCRILVAGVGGAGCNSVARMADTWKEGPSVIAINTDTQSLASCTASRCLVIGEKATRGLGAAGDVATGRIAAEEAIENIQDAIANFDLLFLVTGLGGGTGTGATPVIARAARKLGALTICFATMPFPFEGDRRQRQAEEGLRELRGICDTVICLPNERLFELVDAKTALETAFRTSDQVLASGVHALWSVLAYTGVINLDFADIRQLAEHSGGSCTFAYSEGAGPARAATALQALMDSPLLERGRLLSEAAGVLVNITGGPELTLSDVNGIMGQIRSMVRSNAHCFFGATLDASWKDRLSLTVLVTENWLEERGGKRRPERAPPSSSSTTVDTVVVAGTPSAPQSVDKMSAKETQGMLQLEQLEKGRRFEGVEPTILEGENLDIPTYVRRGLKLSFEQ